MFKGPQSFDPKHPNRFKAHAVVASDSGQAAPAPVMSKKGKLMEELGFDGGSVVTSSDDEDEDPDYGVTPGFAAAHGMTPTIVGGKSGNDAVLKQKLARLQAEADELTDKLAKAEGSNRQLKQMSKATNVMLQKKFTAQIGQQQGLIDAMHAALQRADKAAASSFSEEVSAARAAASSAGSASPTADAGSGSAGSAEVMGLQQALSEADEEISALKRKLRAMDLSGGGSGGGGSSGGAAESKSSSRSEELSALRQRVAGLEKELSSRGVAPPAPPSASGPADAAVKKELGTARRRIKDLEQQLREVETKANATAAGSSSAAAELASKLKDSQSRIADLEAELESAQSQGKAAAAAGKSEAKDVAAKYKKREEKMKRMAEEQFQSIKARAAAEIEELKRTNAAQVEDLQARVTATSTRKESLVRAARGASTATTSIRHAAKGMRKDVEAAFADLTPMFRDASKQIARGIKNFASSYGGIVENYRKEQRQRKRLFNLVQELRGNIRVFCRVRPQLPHEAELKQPLCVTFPAEGELTVTNTKKQCKRFEFDHVFVPGTSNSEVFVEIEPLITSVLDGFNVCIFAYGQTGSGKTYTMEGTSDSRGLNYRALDQLFKLRDERSVDTSFTVSITLLEIYNEEIRDMLRAPGSAAPKLPLKEGRDGMYVDGITTVPVGSRKEVLDIMKTGYRNRSTFATNMNEHSSRSHCMLSVYVDGKNSVTNLRFKGKLHLIDLAGSERVSKSGATGARFEEAKNINKSLSALGDVIQARAQKQGHVPFRNSTLTHLLKDSLSKDSKTLMFVNMSPALGQAEESVCSLNFASRVRTVELGRATKNVSKSRRK